MIKRNGIIGNTPMIKINYKYNGIVRIEGIGDDFVPDLINKKSIDKIILINDNNVINMSKKIAKELGIGVGISSGANMYIHFFRNPNVPLILHLAFLEVCP